MAYEDLSYEDALSVLEGEVHIIDPALIRAARNKAKEALRTMIKNAQTSGRYPIIDSKHAAGTLYGICMMKDMIEFLEGWDARKDVDTVPPGERLTHNQHKLVVGRAAKTLEAVLLYGGTMEEIERATKFALIAIDAEKYSLDTEQAKVKYGFRQLEDKYTKGIQE